MTKDVTLSVRIDRKVSNKLEKLARQAKRSKSAMAVIAIENFFEIQAREIELTKRALARAKAGGPFISDEDMNRWLDSLGTDNPLPRPVANVRLR
jgi:predicted transcriptional regulator